MAKNINVKITDFQEKKIAESGLTTSEFVRRSIDYYDVSNGSISVKYWNERCSGK